MKNLFAVLVLVGVMSVLSFCSFKAKRTPIRNNGLRIMQLPDTIYYRAFDNGRYNFDLANKVNILISIRKSEKDTILLRFRIANISENESLIMFNHFSSSSGRERHSILSFQDIQFHEYSVIEIIRPLKSFEFEEVIGPGLESAGCDLFFINDLDEVQKYLNHTVEISPEDSTFMIFPIDHMNSGVGAFSIENISLKNDKDVVCQLEIANYN